MRSSLCCRSMVVLLGLCGFVAPAADAQQASRPGCTLDFQDHYRCDRTAFQQRFAAAHTVRIDTDRLDLFASRRTQEMVEKLGKSVVPAQQRPRLVFDLAPIDRTGRVELSQADVALATLTVYDTSLGDGPRSRIWVETLDGQPDRPWPTIVVDLLRKFQKDALTD